MSSAHRRLPLRIGTAVAVLLAVAAGLVVAPSVGLILAPAAALMLLLANGVFLGEDVIERLRTRRSMARRRQRPAAAPRPVRPTFVQRAGRAIAFALAVRPPPAPSSVLS